MSCLCCVVLCCGAECLLVRIAIEILVVKKLKKKIFSIRIVRVGSEVKL